MKQLARNLRHNQTDAERLLWRQLSNRQLGGFKFRRQYWIGNYILDFVCIERKMIIELDGSQHAGEMKAASDQRRTTFLESRGFKVLRFWNNEIISNIEAVLESILTGLQNTSHPPLSPQRGEGKKIAAAHPALSPQWGDGKKAANTHSDLLPQRGEVQKTMTPRSYLSPESAEGN